MTPAEWLGSGSAALLGIAGSLAVFRRRLSRDSVEMVKDRAESSFVKDLQRDRDEAVRLAREVFAREAGHLVRIASLESDAAHHAIDIERYKYDLGALRRWIDRRHPDDAADIPSTMADLD